MRSHAGQTLCHTFRHSFAIYEAAAPSAVAKRTIFNAGTAGVKNFVGSQELVDDVSSGRVALEDIKEKELPEELKGMSLQERKNFVDDREAKRLALQKKIEDLAARRQAYIEEKVKQEAGEGAASPDAQIYRCIQAQAAEKEITYSGGPAY